MRKTVFIIQLLFKVLIKTALIININHLNSVFKFFLENHIIVSSSLSLINLAMVDNIINYPIVLQK